MLYRVCWKDGSVVENLDYAESMRLIEQQPSNWQYVQPMEYGMDLDPENDTRRKQWVK